MMKWLNIETVNVNIILKTILIYYKVSIIFHFAPKNNI